MAGATDDLDIGVAPWTTIGGKALFAVSVRHAYNLINEDPLRIDLREPEAVAATGTIVNALPVPPLLTAEQVGTVIFDYSPEHRRTVLVFDADGAVARGEGGPHWAAVEALLNRPEQPCTAVWLLRGGYEAFLARYPFLCGADADAESIYPSAITDSVYLSGYLAAHTLAVVRNLNIRCIVNATNDIGNAFESAESATAAAAKHFSRGAASHGRAPPRRAPRNVSEPPDDLPPIDYVRVPVVDHDGQDLLPYFSEIANLLADNESKGIATIVHCERGISRSAALVAAFLVLSRRWTVDRALDHLRQSRTVARPNAGFERQLRRWAEQLPGGSGGGGGGGGDGDSGDATAMTWTRA